ncbi:GNAT family N-acetyltransferase [Microbacterium lushaniae]|nr:GNAT family N-acetyltransferase [Microbacterium lushaniae]KAA9152000.1 GNAT family N-acetyltransferase [Microbacterium lushaniae]
MTIDIRTVTAGDRAGWCDLYEGYRMFYEIPSDPTAVRTAWDWVSAGEHGFIGLVAVDAGRIVGLANLRRFARPPTAGMGLYLDDLFTAPDARGSGVATALLERAGDIAAQEGANVVRWITAEDNATARRVYDKVASATQWVTYDMLPAAP